jgi:hypothetical protein
MKISCEVAVGVTAVAQMDSCDSDTLNATRNWVKKGQQKQQPRQQLFFF